MLVGAALVVSCTVNDPGDPRVTSGAFAERALGPESSRGERKPADTWGRLVEVPPEVFFAADLSDDVRTGLTNALLAATAEWGNYGPLEYWVLGTDPEAARELFESFSDRRLRLGQWDESDHQSQRTAKDGDHGFESYRRIGADAVANEQPSGSMGWSGNRDWGIHLYLSSYPLGFDRRFGASPGGEQITVFHEYFHAVQQAHVRTRDHAERFELMGPMWFVEGGADYMAHTTARRLWASGHLPLIDNRGLGSLEQCFEEKMRNGKSALVSLGTGINLGDVTYESEGAAAGYDLGCWAIAYLLNEVGQEALLETFYPDLEGLGWEGAFRRTFGLSSEEFYVVFGSFLKRPLAEQLAILPEYDRRRE